jgi:carbonic anhydrase/SulP family sulfate permease
MFLPFIVSVVAIVFTDLIVGILIGLAASVFFIMRSNIRRPVRRILEKHVGGDVFTVRIAGNVAKEKVLGSLEYATRIAGAKLILVLGHTRCGAVTATVDLLAHGADPKRETQCEHLDALIGEIGKSVDLNRLADYPSWSSEQREAFVDDTARRNIRRTVEGILAASQTLRDLVEQGQIKIIGALYDIRTGQIEFDV